MPIVIHTNLQQVPFLVVGFGFCSLCCAFIQNHTHLYIARAFLGLFEGGTMPGIAFFLSNFYRRNELMFRIGFFISASSMSGAFGGLLATGLA
jgi:MFS family permease